MFKSFFNKLKSTGSSSDVTKVIAEYGAWESPITPALISSAAIGLSSISGIANDIIVKIADPKDAGRAKLSVCSGETITDITPEDVNVRTRVHEYGGGDNLPITKTSGFIVDFKTQNLYAYYENKKELVAPGEPYRYADFQFDTKRAALLAVREDHSAGGDSSTVVNTVVAIPLSKDLLSRMGVESQGATFKDVTVLAGGADFYASPKANPSSTALVWIEWNHPSMPWDDTKLMIAPFTAKPEADTTEITLGDAKCIAGDGPNGESVADPLWDSDDRLFFITDRRNGWWNLHEWKEGSEPFCVWEEDRELGGPKWIFGRRAYDRFNDGTILMTGSKNRVLLLPNGDKKDVLSFSICDPSFSILHVVALEDEGSTKNIAILAGSPKSPMAVYRVALADGKASETKLIQSVDPNIIDPAFLTEPKHIHFPTLYEGKVDKAYGQLYMPKNPVFEAPEGKLPPLLVKLHGGPTAATTTLFNLSIQFWTSRGFAVLDTNYGGSTSYGREYRERLKLKWGIVDVQDCIAGASYLAGLDLKHPDGSIALKATEKSVVDKTKLAIDGGSAGGFTTLACMAFSDIFNAGAAYYGVSDIVALAQETHKFESRYMVGMVGRYPEDIEVYKERSPINNLKSLNCPLLVLQGDEDKIVPPNQSITMYEAVKAKGVPCSMIMYAGEQHGFRKQENIENALASELNFYGKVFKFTPDIKTNLQVDNEENI